MANIPEFIFDQVNGPRLVLLNQDGINTSSIYIDTNNILRTSEGTPINVATSSVTLLAMTASYVSPQATASYTITASYVVVSQTASFVQFVNVGGKPTLVSSSAQISYTGLSNIPSGIVSSSAQVVSNLSGQQVSVAGITGSLLGTASFVTTAQTASFIATASWANNVVTAQTASFIATASWANNVVTAQTASFIATASWAMRAVTASFLLGSISSAISASWASQSLSSSFATTAQTASFIATASWAMRAVTASFVATSSWSQNSRTASYVLWANDTFLGTASYAIKAATSSYLSATNIDLLGVTNLMRTASFILTTANTWYELGFNLDTRSSSYWNHPANTGQFTCSIDGYYNIAYFVNMVKTAGGSAQVAGTRILRNGIGWTGSYVGGTYGSNNTNQILTNSTTEYITSGSRFILQVASDINSNFTVSTYPVSTLAPATLTYSAKLIITRI